MSAEPSRLTPASTRNGMTHLAGLMMRTNRPGGEPQSRSETEQPKGSDLERRKSIDNESVQTIEATYGERSNFGW